MKLPRLTLPGLMTLLLCLALCACGGGGKGSSLSAQPDADKASGPDRSAPLSDEEFAAGAPSLRELKEFLFSEFERLGIDPAKEPLAVSTESPVFDMTGVINDPDGEGPEPDIVVLDWTEYFPGDYDMNGLVSISDLTPLGIRFKDSVAYDDPALHDGFEFFPSGGPTDDSGVPLGQPLPETSGADNWRRARIDGDGNTEINISDITPIAIHFQESLSGYRIYRKLEGEAEFSLLPMPGQPEAELTIPRSSTFEQGSSGPDPNRPVRYHFEDLPPPGLHQYYVAPFDTASGEEGEAGNIVEIEVGSEIIDPPDNLPPVADLLIAPTSGRLSVEATLDASASTDPDGSIVGYEWDFNNDGTVDESGTEPVVVHLYDTPGSYTATVTVIDNESAEDSAEGFVEVTANLAPTASITADVLSGEPGLEVNLDASASVDSDGSIAKFEWDFEGDGVYDFDSGLQNTVSHVYADSGDYFPMVRVTDNDGATAEASLLEEISVNLGPTAVINSDVTTGGDPLLVNFDGEQSTDSDGEIAWYEWDFDGNGTPDSQGGSSVRVFIYVDPGTYNAALRVTDDDGAVSDWSAPIEITVADAPNAAITADPEVGDPPLTVNFDASGSTDNGTIDKYEWDFDGDGTYDEDTGNVPLASFEYTERGVYYARVQVTDNEGYTGTASVLIRVRLFPTASMIATPSEGPAPLAVTLDASASEPGSSPIVQYEWDFGDGSEPVNTPGNEPTIDHTYTRAGFYTASVRVVDADEGFDTATADIKATGWRITVIPGSAGNNNRLRIVDGRPAIVGNASSGLWYFRAADELGMVWDASEGGIAVNVWDQTDFVPGLQPGFEVIDGHPAASFVDQDWTDSEDVVENAMYVRALDPQGASWGAPVMIEAAMPEDPNGLAPAGHTALVQANGRPAMAYIRGDGAVRYTRANDASGILWPSAATVHTGVGVQRSLDMTIVQGNPAFVAAGTYRRANDADGSTWGSTVNAGATYFNKLKVIAGQPKTISAVAIEQSDRFTFRYDFANNATGTSWTNTTPEGGEEIGNFPGLGDFDGLPAFMFVERDSGTLFLRRGTNTDGSAFGPRENIISGLQNVAGHIDMGQVQGLNAFTVYASPGGGGSRTLRYGIYIE